MRTFLACALAVAIVAGGAYAVLRSVQNQPTEAYTTGGSSRLDWREHEMFDRRPTEVPRLIAE